MADKLFISIPDSANYQLPDAGLLQYYKDLDNRAYSLIGEVDENLLDFVSKIIEWNREDKDIPVEERTPIKFYINSPGGSLDVNYTLIDIIHMSKTPVIDINLGVCCSAAAYIYLSCHKRYMLPHSYFVFHQGSSNLGGSYAEVMAAIQDYQGQVEELSNLLKNSTHYTEEEIAENIITEWYVRKDEALEKGVCDKVLKDIDELL